MATTLRGSPVVVAPGKIFLIGEYAVLDGGVAVLAAVSRYAVAQYLPDLSPETPLIEETVKRAAAALGDLAKALPTGSALVNTAEFRHRVLSMEPSQGSIPPAMDPAGQGPSGFHATKLGLGSSAAAAVAAAGSVLEMAGLPIDGKRDLLFSIADESHRAAQGGVGSGADVAVSVQGGCIAFVRPPRETPVITPLRKPPQLHLLAFWTGGPVSTAAMIRAVSSLAARSPAAYRTLIGQMRDSADHFVGAFAAGNAAAVVAQASLYGELLDELGTAAGVEIVTPRFRAAAALASRLGGAAKPSGAGGGDVGVAFFTEAAAATAFTRECPPGVSVLDIRIDFDGARRRRRETVDLTK